MCPSMTRHFMQTVCGYAFACALLTSEALAQQKQFAPPEFQAWPPVTDAEKGLQAPVVEKDAGAEVLVWRAHLVDEVLSRGYQRVWYHYVRLKIFTDRGREQLSTTQLSGDGRSHIIDVAARTVKADGTVLELDKNAVFQRDLIRVGGIKVKTASFGMPGLEVGAIVEYRWKEVLEGYYSYVRIEFQREFPVQRVTYFIKPFSSQYTASEIHIQSFNCQPSPFKLENDGYNSTTLQNVPATHEEPFEPSAPNIRPWALLYYESRNPKDPDRFWNDLGKEAYDELKRSLKLNDELKTAAATAIAGAKTDQEKLSGLIRYIQRNLRNVSSSELTDAERQTFYDKLPNDRPRTSPEIFKSGMGTSYELNLVFAAMASQAGFDTRPAPTADWNDVGFNPKTMLHQFYLRNIDMAVKSGDSWKIYDASTKLQKPGMLPWSQEGLFALVSDPRKPVFVQTEQTPAKESVDAKTAKLALSADGTLEGDVEESFTGHRAFDRRAELEGQSNDRQTDWLRDRVTKVFPDAEVNNVVIDSAADATQPLKFRYHLKAPGYAQVVGSRVFFNILPFERSRTSPFTASDRRNPIRFPYSWVESDAISIKLPAGFMLDNAASPGSLSFGKAGGYNLKIGVSENGDIVMNRELTFNALYFDVEQYPIVRQVFSEIQKRDTHTLALAKAR